MWVIGNKQFFKVGLITFLRCIFIIYIKNGFFKSSQISVTKVQCIRSKLIVVKLFVIMVFDNFKFLFLKINECLTDQFQILYCAESKLDDSQNLNQ